MSRHPSQNPSRDLGEENQHQQRGSQLPLVWHQSRVQYNDRSSALVMGQFLPVWDLKRWCQLQRFQAVGVTALLSRGRLVARDARENIDPYALLEAYRTQIVADAYRERGEKPPESPVEDTHLCDRMKVIQLGNCGGLRVVQPDPHPIGAIPMESRMAWGRTPTFHYESMSLWEWVDTVRVAPGGVLALPDVISRRPPELGFFVKDGPQRGWDLDAEELQTFRQVQLPFSWYSAEELNLLDSSKESFDGVEEAARLALSLSAAVRRKAHEEKWGSRLYVGFVDYENQEPVQEVVSVDDFRDSGTGLAAIYEIPYQKTLPLSGLQNDPVRRVRQLQSENVPRRALQIDETSVGSRYAAMPSQWW